MHYDSLESVGNEYESDQDLKANPLSKSSKKSHQKSKYRETTSDYDDEEELKEEVGDLPPRIEDLEIQDYEEDNDSATNDDPEDENELPTVVIDSSMDDKDAA